MSIAEVINPMLDWLEAGRRLTLATVIETWGSSPRPAGSCLAVGYGAEDADLRLAGSVSGGCVEAAVIELGREVLASGRPALVDYGVRDEDARALGLACGGRLQVLVQPLEDGSDWDRIRQRLVAGLELVLAQPLDGGRIWLIEPSGRPDRDTTDQGFGPGPLAPPELELAAFDALRRGEPGIVELAGARWALLPQRPEDPLIIVGAGHVAQHLTRLAGPLGFRVTVVDPRAAFATEERFPGADGLLVAWPDAGCLGRLGLGEASYLVALAHDPKIDDPALAAALDADARYVGALGSRRSHAARLERLGEQGVSEASSARIHAPVGLDIGARTPAEIALSVLAEMVAHRRGAGSRVAQD